MGIRTLQRQCDLTMAGGGQGHVSGLISGALLTLALRSFIRFEGMDPIGGTLEPYVSDCNSADRRLSGCDVFLTGLSTFYLEGAPPQEAAAEQAKGKKERKQLAAKRVIELQGADSSCMAPIGPRTVRGLTFSRDLDDLVRGTEGPIGVHEGEETTSCTGHMS